MTSPFPSETPASAFLESYRALAGTKDEMLAPDGSIVPVWKPFIRHLASLGPEEVARRFERGDQYLRDAGVLFRQYDDTVSSEREWPLSHIPVMLSQREWSEIAEGLVQRAEVLEYMVQDFYGANHLVASGQIPATLLTRNSAWLRPMVGVQTSNKYALNFISFEIGRGPNGKWWVIDDLLASPSTTGFAIENRVALSRTFPNFFANANVHRLAGFFQQLQQTLFKMSRGGEGDIGVLTPGPLNQDHAEHAYLARYLGLLLVEGEDLVVRNGQAMVRTVAGLRPLSLLWNRVPEGLIDPLELDSASLLGTPGLLSALRSGTLRTLNKVGAGVLETRALMAFIPRIARDFLGTDLKISNIATWWCGQEAERLHVIANAEKMVLSSAYSTVPLMSEQSNFVAPNGMDHQTHPVRELIGEAGRDIVGQEAVTLSTTPAFEKNGLVPRPTCIRVFLLRTSDGWQVMPGGYARVSAYDDPKAFAMQRGGRVADVWVVDNAPVDRPSLLSTASAAEMRHSAETILPSRAADNLFWVGRNVERAEVNMRLFRAYFARLSENETPDAPLLAYMRSRVFRTKQIEPNALAESFGKPLRLALQAATKISDRFSPDGMRALKEIAVSLRALEERRIALDQITREINPLLRQLTGFAGLVHENMYRSDGWRFLSIGTSVERSASMCELLGYVIAPDAPDGMLDLALEVGDSVVSHRARFSIIATNESVLDLLALDLRNPRAIRYHISRIRDHVADLPGHPPGHSLNELARRILILETELATRHAEGMTPDMLIEMRRSVWDLSDVITATHLV